MRFVASLFVVTSVMLGSLILGSQSGLSQHASDVNQKIAPANLRPDLGVRYQNTSIFKIVSRKNSFRLGEMMSIDLALLNVSDTPVYFASMSEPLFTVRNRTGRQFEIVPYIILERLPGLDGYELFPKQKMATKSFDVLIGCDPRAVEGFSELRHEQNDRRAFAQDWSLNWGDFCLDVTRPGTYTISAELVNDYVVLSSSGEKTAVDKVRSSPFVITVTR